MGNRLTTEALCFGGQQCTATDMAIACQVAPAGFCSNEDCLVRLASSHPAMVYAAMREMRKKLKAAIDSVKVHTVFVCVYVLSMCPTHKHYIPQTGVPPFYSKLECPHSIPGGEVECSGVAGGGREHSI